MTSGFTFPKPEFDIESTVERAMALINRTLQPSLAEAQQVVDKVRAGKPLVPAENLVGEVTRGNRIRAARAVSYSLPSILPGYGTADRKSTRLNSSQANISYAVFCLIKKNHSTIHVPVTAPSLPTDQPGSDVAAVQSLAFFLLLSKVPIIHVDTKCDTGLAWFRDLIL